ncbi:hypothetical protein LTR08_000026 [Meristemomyces frigidus]|nr:hypothetical protein LTR08_000026 [Meristemomyces frigidus]
MPDWSMQGLRRFFAGERPRILIAQPSTSSILTTRSPPAGTTVANGRVLKRRRPLRGNTADSGTRPIVRPCDRAQPALAAPVALPWAGKWSRFTTTLVRLVNRDAELRLFELELTDLQPYWNTLQTHIDAVTLRQRRIPWNPSDEDRAERHSLQRVIDGYRTDQNRLVQRQEHVKRMLKTGGEMQRSERRALFRMVGAYIERAPTGGDCVQLTPRLEEMLLDAAEITEFVTSQADEIDVLTRRSDELRPGSLEIASSDNEVAEKLRQSAQELVQLHRAMPVRFEYRDLALRVLCAVARHTLLEQGFIKPESGEQSERRRPAPVTGYSDEPGTPALDSEDEDEYERLRDRIRELRGKHDGMQKDNCYDSDLATYLRESPDSTRLAFDKVWRDRRGQLARELHDTEETFVRVRDRALRAGARPLGLDEEAGYVREFSGRHPQDGTVDCMLEAAMRYRQEKAVTDAPRITGWAGGVAEDATADVVANRHSDADLWEQGLTAEVMPWDSRSSREERPQTRLRISEYRRMYGQGSSL